MFTDENVRQVNDCIQQVVAEFHQFPNALLTEDDLRMHLCCKLLTHFSRIQTTHDNDRSIELHSEVRWYGDGDLHLRSDIVLVDVSTLDVLRYDEMPTKGYGFNFPFGIIELKLRRPVGEADNVFKSQIQVDVEKLRTLRDVFHHNEPDLKQTQFWLVVLDKKSDLQFGIEEPDKHWLSCTYRFADRITGDNRNILTTQI